MEMNYIIIYIFITLVVFIILQFKIEERTKSVFLKGNYFVPHILSYLKELKEIFIKANLRK
jgi:putative effector of murein hydrolase